jgi:hypothetical protein
MPKTPGKTASKTRKTAQTKTAQTKTRIKTGTKTARKAPRKSARAEQPTEVPAESAAAESGLKIAAAAAADEPRRPHRSTLEDDRGGQFFEKIRMWRILHEDRGQTRFTKAILMERFYEDHADRKASFELRLALAEPGREGAIRREAAKERDTRKRHVERLVEVLKKIGVPIDDVDERDRPIDEDELAVIQRESPFAERVWKYNPDGEWARHFHELLDTYGIHGYELLGMMACRTLLQDLAGLPQPEAVRSLVDRMTALVPKEMREQMLDEARAWRYSLGDTSKYASPAKKEGLTRWYEATILRRQVEIEHQTPGKPVRIRRLAALGTLFDREENSVYLLGCEEDPEKPGSWKWPLQWKFDRVSSVRLLPDRNPPLSAIWPHERVRAAAGPGPERLDIARLFCDSVGCFFRYGEPTVRLEVLIHSPGWMAWCIEKPFHPKQRVFHETDEAGNPVLRLVVDRCDEEEICSRLLRLGGSFTVLQPTSLIRKLKATAAAITGRHG